MESLVSYCSDEEENESYPGNMDPSSINREVGVFSRQLDEDTNYDNVQMDMSEESNNNNSPDRNSSEHSDDSSDSEKSSVSSSNSHSRKSSSSSDESPERGNHDQMSSSQSSNPNIRGKEKSSEVHALKRQSQNKDDLPRKHSQRSQEMEEKEHESLKRDHRNKDRVNRHERSRDKDYSRDVRSHGHGKDRRENRRNDSCDRRSRSQGKDQRTSPHHRDRDRHGRKGGSPDRKRARSRSRSPGHSYSSSSSSRSSKDSHRARSRSRERLSSSARSRSKERSERHRSRSKDRQRSRSRERRRGAYEKKPNKLTILERLGIELRPPDSMPAVTPQQLLQRSMEQQVAQVKTSTGIELPKYYNPAAMNPLRYAEQMQKRKLLWGNKVCNTTSQVGTTEPKPTSNNKWEGTTFAQDQDGKMTAKFKRLMGIKDSGQGSGCSNSSAAVDSNELLKKQEELFNSMEMQYEVARVATHTHRGVGLGFGTFQYPR